MINNICARHAKTAFMQCVDAWLKVPYLFVFRALFCPYLHKDKATKQTTAYGHWESCFIQVRSNLFRAVLVAPPTLQPTAIRPIFNHQREWCNF